MSDKEKEAIRNWIKCWARTGPILEQLKREDILSANTQMSIEFLDDAFESALWLYPPLPTSGLIEQQRLFKQVKR